MSVVNYVIVVGGVAPGSATFYGLAKRAIRLEDVGAHHVPQSNPLDALIPETRINDEHES